MLNQLTDHSPHPVLLSWLYFCLYLFSGGVTEEAAGGTTGRERSGQEEWSRCEGALRARGPLRPQPGSHGARSPTGAGGAAEAARAPDERVAERKRQAAAGGDPGHGTRSDHPNITTQQNDIIIIKRNLN